MSRSFVRKALLAAFCMSVLMVSVAASSAAAAVSLGVGGERPAAAYDPSTGTTYVVWGAPEESGVDLCVLPSGASACSPGTIKLIDNTVGVKGVFYEDPQVTVEPGGSVVVSTNVDGATGGIPGGYTNRGTVAWSSAAGGAGFAVAGQGLADGGDLLAPDSTPGSGAAALGASPLQLAVFGYFGGNSAFSAFSLSASAPATPVKDSSEDFGNDLDADSSQVAALPNTPTPGEDLVVLVGGGLFNKFSECPLSERHTGYAAAKGTLGNLNKQATWPASFKALDCHAQAPVLASGPSGIGVLEDEGTGIEGAGADNIAYRAFNTTSMEFGAPVEISDETSSALLGADKVSLSQDAAGGVYAMWGDERGLEMSYSTTGGATWAPPITVPGTSLGDPVIAAVGGGTFEVAYTANPGGGSQEFLEPLNYAAVYAAEHAPPAPAPIVPVAIHPPVVKPPATITANTTFEGEKVGLSVPNQCVKDGKVVGTLTFRLASHKRKGKVVVKIYKVVFKVGTASKTITRKKLINKPFVAKLQIKHPKAGAKYVLTARAFIAVKHGKPRSKTLKVTLTTCA